jgi:hypothetical protein
MAYTPKEWQCDELITANDLNRMEDGIQEAKAEIETFLAGGGKFVKFTDTVAVEHRTDYPTQKTYSASRVAEIFGTSDTSKIHIISLDAYYNTSASWCTQPATFTDAANRWYDFPRYDLQGDGSMVISLTDPFTTSTVNQTFRLVAFVAD